MSKIDEMVESILKKAKVDLTKGDLNPIFFIGNSEKLNIVAAEWENDLQKDRIAALVRRESALMKADYVLFLAESWSLDGEAAAEFQKNRHRYRQVADHPQRIEVVTIFIESHTFARMGLAKILPGRKMGDIQWTDEGTKLEGRFSNFLGQKQEVN